MEDKKNAPVGYEDVLNPALNERVKKTTEQLRALAEQGSEAFWAEMSKGISWYKEWNKIFDDSNAPFYKWFLDGKLNACYNCVDRHLSSWRKNKAAIIFEGELGDSRVLTYQDLYREVNKLANVLKGLGIKRGDVVAIYLQMIPEAVIAMLACTRIGALHSVVFGGFSSEALKERINDSKSRILITSDGGYRRGKAVPMKNNADKALADNGCPSIEKVIVVKRTGQDVPMEPGRDLWYRT